MGRISVTKEEIVKLYVEERRTVNELATLFSCSVRTIHNYLEKYEITKRSQSEIMSGRKLTEEHRLKIINNLKHQKGEANPNWKGGVSYTESHGFVYRIVRVNGKYVKEHRYNMEKFLGRKLESTEEVHHIDKNTLNNEIGNLKILSKSEHLRLHQTAERKKLVSNKIKTIRAERFWSSRKIK